MSRSSQGLILGCFQKRTKCRECGPLDHIMVLIPMPRQLDGVLEGGACIDSIEEILACLWIEEHNEVYLKRTLSVLQAADQGLLQNNMVEDLDKYQVAQRNRPNRRCKVHRVRSTLMTGEERDCSIDELHTDVVQVRSIVPVV